MSSVKTPGVETEGFYPCPACLNEKPSLEKNEIATDSRANDHYYGYVCECGFHGREAYLNSTWDEKKCEEQARVAWNESVAEAMLVRSENEDVAKVDLILNQLLEANAGR